ncbi:MAG: hypothetical protein R3C59_20375 [Planctomycetaceae bacterium]
MTRYKYCLLTLLTLLSLSGCGGGGIDRQDVQGAVTFDGQPVVYGEILFQPTSGPAGSAVIRDGRYDTAAEEGLGILAGPHKLLISAYEFEPIDLGDAVDETAEDSSDSAPTPLFVNYEMDADLSGGTHDIAIPADARGFGVGAQSGGSKKAASNEP